MKRRVQYLLVFISILFATQSSGYTLYGAGTNSCGEWVSERSSGNWHSKGQWMLGVLSAVGYYGVYELKKVDSQAFAVWMDNYCQKNPLEQFSHGVYKLVEDLSKKNP